MNQNYDLNSKKEILNYVHDALEEKGYDPIAQLVGYLLTNELTYITTHVNARSVLRRFENEDYLIELVWNDLNLSPDNEIGRTLKLAFDGAVTKKGMSKEQAAWNIVGFLLTNDPTYIVTYDGARQKMTGYECDEIVEHLLREYLNKY